MFTISITVTDDGGSTASATASATIVDAPLTVSANPIKVMMGVPFSGQVATFTDANPTAPLTDFTATIDWGDGTTTPGVITQPGGTGTAFVVSGTHTYATADNHVSTVASFNTTLWTTWSTGVTWVDVQVGDFTGDGKADIVGRALESGQWWVNQSTGASFNPHLWTTWANFVTWVDVKVGDFTGDGK